MERPSAKQRRPIERCMDAMVKEDRRDRISALDDDVLLHILSFMPTIYAVRTGVLSKRWLYLWTSLPCLTFHDYCERFEDADDGFSRFVDRTLFFLKSPKITRLDLVLGGAFPSLDFWILFAILRNVEEITLDLYEEIEPYKLPGHLFMCSSLTRLTLKRCSLEWKGRITWTSLEELKLDDCHLTDDFIDNMFVQTPVLEHLELLECEGIEKLHITSPSLKELLLKNIGVEVLGPMEIDAPYLHSLSITEYNVWWNIQLLNLSSLVSARIEIGSDDIQTNHEVQNMIRKMIERLCDVTRLTIGHMCIWCLPKLDAKSLHLPSLKCKSLTMSTQILYRDFPRIAALLYSSCELEELIIDMVTAEFTGFIKRREENSCKSYWTSCKTRFTCLDSHLKTIKIIHKGYRFRKVAPLLRLVHFLLKKAHVLEKMVFQDCNQVITEGPSVQVARVLLSLRRSSPHARILFA